MPVAKLRAISKPDVMKSAEGNDSPDTSIRQSTGKEPLLSFSRTGDGWMQLFHALDQQDLPGWPLYQVKVQMQKCEKCSREFCSPINYRRHIRVHRRSLKVDKESHKSRDLLGAYWDKLSMDEAKEILSFMDVKLEEVDGSSIIKALTSFICKPGPCALPQGYMRAGSALLDLIQARPSRHAICSQELFSILDDASEKTFLCAGMAGSMQKYVFDGDAGKIGLELKNLVACTSFLVEQKLVKAWFADKDAEALRLQKLLVEEEEAAQRRQAELLERKRLKKLRQNEQKMKGQANSEKAKEVAADILDALTSAETSSTPEASDSDPNILETPFDHASSLLEPVHTSITEENADTEAQFGLSYEHHLDAGTSPRRAVQQGSGRRHLVIPRWQVPKSHRVGQNGFHGKYEAMQKYGAARDPRAAPTVNGSKVWTRKLKSANEEDSLNSRLVKEAGNQTDQNKNSEVLIGSISVILGDCTDLQHGHSLSEAEEVCSFEHAVSKNNGQEKLAKTDSVQFCSNRSAIKLWKPVTRHEISGPTPVQSGGGEPREDGLVGGGTLPNQSCLRSCALDDNECGRNSHPLWDNGGQPECLLFSGGAAKAFLARRWKDAIASDHVKLVLSPESEPRWCPDIENDCQVVKTSSPESTGASESTNSLTVKAKSRTKPEKGMKIQYIPKQRTVP